MLSLSRSLACGVGSASRIAVRRTGFSCVLPLTLPMVAVVLLFVNILLIPNSIFDNIRFICLLHVSFNISHYFLQFTRKKIQLQTQSRNSPSNSRSAFVGARQDDDASCVHETLNQPFRPIAPSALKLVRTCREVWPNDVQCGQFQFLTFKDERHNHHQTGGVSQPSVCVRVCVCLCVLRMWNACVRVLATSLGAEHTLWGRLSRQRDERFSCSCSRYIA